MTSNSRQVGPGIMSEVKHESQEVRKQMSALQHDAGGLAQQVAGALASFKAANPPYQAPPQEDKVAITPYV